MSDIQFSQKEASGMRERSKRTMRFCCQLAGDSQQSRWLSNADLWSSWLCTLWFLGKTLLLRLATKSLIPLIKDWKRQIHNQDNLSYHYPLSGKPQLLEFNFKFIQNTKRICLPDFVRDSKKIIIFDVINMHFNRYYNSIQFYSKIQI